MIKIELEKPKIISFDTKNGLTCKISHQLYVEKNLGIKLPVRFSLFMNLTEKNEDGKLILPFDGNKIFGKETATQINEINKLVGRCSQIAERLFDKLKRVNDSLKSNPELTSIFEKYDNDDRKYVKLDFMTHRQLLSDIIKSKKIDRINDVSSGYDIKSVRRAMNDFILERNKYTHGELLYWYPEKKTLLEYLNSKGETEYAELNMDILNSFSECYVSLDKYLNKITE
ncbi:hypothetical protein [Tenacibaculum maritimum]|uniref:hypothetical protein n=1 Tax=Tenacibaculum maritimum TaxID=107401 RepID=UPI0012E698B9|nr:hypothetical protein [Tenacibaculum maritimum]CAA0235348.1 conserved hypothetical protein [Tenacibaculum maritimum]